MFSENQMNTASLEAGGDAKVGVATNVQARPRNLTPLASYGPTPNSRPPAGGILAGQNPRQKLPDYQDRCAEPAQLLRHSNTRPPCSRKVRAGESSQAAISDALPNVLPPPGNDFAEQDRGQLPNGVQGALAQPARQTLSDGGHVPHDDHSSLAIVGTIVEQHRRAVDLQRARLRLELQAQAVCRRLSDGDKAAAGKLWSAVRKDEGHELRLWLAPFIASIELLDGAEHEVVNALKRHARQMPIHAWAADIKGLGEASLAAMIGSLGATPADYRSPAAIWKRMGLAVINGGRQRRVAGDEALLHGYDAARRSLMWNVGECLIKAQVRKDPDDPDKRVGIGDYGQLYLDRKAFELGRETTPMHAHNRAKRYMEKRLLREMWRADRRLAGLNAEPASA